MIEGDFRTTERLPSRNALFPRVVEREGFQSRHLLRRLGESFAKSNGDISGHHLISNTDLRPTDQIGLNPTLLTKFHDHAKSIIVVAAISFIKVPQLTPEIEFGKVIPGTAADHFEEAAFFIPGFFE